jgi:hypothetical protein
MTSTRLVFSHTLWVPEIFPDFESELLKIEDFTVQINCPLCGTKEMAKGDTVMTV